ncbi:ABC transporter permease [Nibricoccus sp. IMCC34717]|uniref:ABC transporter permease n=1 Tax=Nibricoccus sp. IMCC34717 TaxID=3034021 RepID=UPI00384DB73D
MINWFLQVVSLTWFNIRTLPERRGSTAASIVGIAGVVLVLVGVLSIAAGFRKALVTSGSPDTVIVLRAGSDTEMTSGLGRDDVRFIADAPGLARGPDGPLASPELFVIINLPKRSTGTDANIPLRGVGKLGFAVRDGMKVVAGRNFEPGRNEVIVGAAAAGQFAGLDLGAKIRVGQNEWNVVGIFTANGGVAESEIWADAAVLQAAYRRGDTYQSVNARLASPASFQQFKDAISLNPQVNATVQRQTDFFAEQSSVVTAFITNIGVFIAGLMALGALFGALNTMYSAVSARTREIATLRALGFGRAPIILSVLLESLVLALLGGMLGGFLAWVAFDGHQSSTINWQTFSQVAFSFSVTPALLVKAITWSAFIGLVGGLLPAIRASRTAIATALREV